MNKANVNLLNVKFDVVLTPLRPSVFNMFKCSDFEMRDSNKSLLPLFFLLFFFGGDGRGQRVGVCCYITWYILWPYLRDVILQEVKHLPLNESSDRDIMRLTAFTILQKYRFPFLNPNKCWYLVKQLISEIYLDQSNSIYDSEENFAWFVY